MKERRKPFDKYRYKVCPIIEYCTRYKRNGCDACVDCELDPRTPSLTALKNRIKLLSLVRKNTIMLASLRFPRISYFLKFILLPFLLGIVLTFVGKVALALILG